MRLTKPRTLYLFHICIRLMSAWLQGYYRDTKHEIKREADAAKGWFQGKKEEAKPREDPSQDLGAAYRDAKEQVKSGAGYVRDRCTIVCVASMLQWFHLIPAAQYGFA